MLLIFSHSYGNDQPNFGFFPAASANEGFESILTSHTSQASMSQSLQPVADTNSGYLGQFPSNVD